MAYSESYITKIFNYMQKHKLASSEYNNDLTLLKAQANNAVEGVAETKAAVNTINTNMAGLVAGAMPDGSVTSAKLADLSVRANHVSEDVYAKVPSLQNFHLTNVNTAHMLYAHTPATDMAPYSNMLINRAPALQQLSYSGAVRNVTQDTLQIQVSSGADMSNPVDMTGYMYFAENAGTSKYPEIYGVSGAHSSLMTNTHYILFHVVYHQVYTPAIPFNDAESITIKIATDGDEYTVNNEDAISRYTIDADDAGYTNSIVIKGVKDGVENPTALYTATGISKLFRNITLLAGTVPGGVLDYDSYNIYFDYYMYLQENSKLFILSIHNYTSSYKGWQYWVKYDNGNFSNSFRQSIPLYGASVTTTTATVFNTINTGAIVFDTPTKYITVGYTGASPLKVRVYTDDLPAPLENTDAVLVGVNMYQHKIALEALTGSCLIEFEALDGESITTDDIAGYYIVG